MDILKKDVRLIGWMCLCLCYLVLYTSPAFAEDVLGGIVIDKHTGQGLSHVYIKQKDSLNAVFTDEGGQFKIILQRGFPQSLIIEKEGYEPIFKNLDVSMMEPHIRLELVPLTVYRSPVPPAHTPTILKPSPIFGSQFTAFYQVHHESLSGSISGWGLNEIGVDSHVYFSPWLLNGQVFRSRIPVDVANFPFQPAFFLNTLQIRLGGGPVWALNDCMALYLGPEFLYQNRSPDNRDNQNKDPVRYTNTLMDFEQNRLSLGARLMWGWNITDRLSLLPEVGIYPLGLLTLTGTTDSPIRYLGTGEIGSRLRFQIIPGLFATAQYSKQVWLGDGLFDHADYFRIGLSVDPWKMAEESQKKKSE